MSNMCPVAAPTGFSLREHSHGELKPPNLSWRFITYSKYHTVVICPTHQVDKTNRSVIRRHMQKLIFPLIQIKVIHQFVPTSRYHLGASFKVFTSTLLDITE